MAIKHDTQGFLVGEPIDMGSATNELSAIREDTSAMRQSLEELLSRAPAAKQSNAEASPQIAARRDGFANVRDEDYPKTVKPGGRGNFARGQGSSELAGLLSKFSRGPTGPIVIPRRGRTNTSAPSTDGSQDSGGPRSSAQIVKELRSTRLSMRQAVTPSRRDGRGRFARTDPQTGADPAGSPDADGVPRTSSSTGDFAGRIADAVKEAVHGVEDVDPSIKAFQEIAGPLSRGYELLGGGKGRDPQDRWYRRIFNVLSGFRKDESVANKKTQKRLKAIEEKPVGEEGGGFFGLLLTALSMLAGIVPAIMAGIAGLLAMIPGVGPIIKSLARVFPGLAVASAAAAAAKAAKGAAPVAAAAAGANKAAKKPSLWQRMMAPSAVPDASAGAAKGATPTPGADKVAKTGRLAQAGKAAGSIAKGAGAIVKRIPVLGAIVAMGLGALGSRAVEADETTTRQEKNTAHGKTWGGVTGSVAGMTAGAAIGTAIFPGVGTAIGGIVGALVGDWLGGEAGEIIGSKWESFTNSMQSGWEVVRDAGLATWDWARSDIFPAIAAKAGKVWDSLKATVSGAWETLTGIATTAFDGLKTGLEKFDGWVKSLPIIGPVVEKTQELVKVAHQATVNATTDAIEATANYADEVKAGGKQLVEDTTKAAGNYWDEIKAGAALAVSDAGNVVESALPQALQNKYHERRDATAARREQRSAQERGELGATSRHFESGKGGAGTVSSGKGDHGGASYGTYQLSSSQGTLQKFLSSSGYGKEFAGLTPGSAAFNAKWKEKASGDSAFGDAQHSFIKATHYDPQVGRLAKAGIDLSTRGKAVQDSVWSTSVQFGGQTPLIQNALHGRDASRMSDAEIITAIQDYKLANNDKLFSSSSAGVRSGTAKRAITEKERLLALVTQAESAPIDIVAAPAVASHEAQSESTPPVVAARPAAPVALASIPAVSVPAAPVTVSLSMPSAPAAPKVPAMEEPAQIQTPLASIPSGGLQNKQGQQWKDVGQDLRERGIAHIVTGGLSSSGVG